jgi:hypothetical protein
MIGFNHLGRLGRLGNQMFQYAALRGIAENNGYNFCMPHYYNAVDDGLGNKLRTLLFEPFKMMNVKQLNIQLIDNKRPTLQESSFGFDEKLFNECPDWTNIHGFFQTEKYFAHIRPLLLCDFMFKDEIMIPCIEMMSGIGDAISLHVRRTDFITNPNHTALDLSYYVVALSTFDKSLPVLVFSDDPKWCHEQELFSDDRFMISENNQDYVDLCLMTMCKYHIVANSSFSWWGAWLSSSENVVAPNLWFGPLNSHLDIKDIIPESWTKLHYMYS